MQEVNSNPPVLVNGQVANELQGLVHAQRQLVCMIAGTMTQLLGEAANVMKQCADENCDRIRAEVRTMRTETVEELKTARVQVQENAKIDRVLVKLEAEHRVLEYLASKKASLEAALDGKNPGPVRDSLQRQLDALVRHEKELIEHRPVWANGETQKALPAPAVEDKPRKKVKKD